MSKLNNELREFRRMWIFVTVVTCSWYRPR